MKTRRMLHQMTNTNRIVRVRNDKIHHCLKEVSRSLNCPYQTCFEVLMDMFENGYVFGRNSRDVLAQKILEKYTNPE